MGHSRLSLEPSVLKIGVQEEEDALVGSKCKECGRYFFPQRKWCAHCAEPTTEVVELSKEGTISSYSLMARKQNYCLVELPYILGEVMMPEGILIYSVINAKDPKELRMGQKARFGTTEIKKDEKGNSVMAYWFTPVK